MRSPWMIGLLALAGAAVSPAPAQAQRNPCAPDAQRFCPETRGNRDTRRLCMKAHQLELSPQCQRAREARRAAGPRWMDFEARATRECRREFHIGRNGPRGWRRWAILDQCVNRKRNAR